jgi:hypothetical protein
MRYSIKPERLSIGMRARIKSGKHSWNCYAGRECLLVNISYPGNFSVIVLPKGDRVPLRKRKSTIANSVSWVNEESLEWVDSDFKKNFEFIEWYVDNIYEF